MNVERKRRLADLLRGSGALAASRALRVAGLGRPALTILGYHRVAVDPAPFSPLAVDPIAFEAQIAWFSRRFDLWPLGRVADWLEGRVTLRRDTLVITFDDGYADNLTLAVPVLERHRAPATFFVSTGPTCRGTQFWWDELRHGLRRVAAGAGSRPGADAAIAAAPKALRPLVLDYLRAATAPGYAQPSRADAARALVRAARAWPQEALADWFAVLHVEPGDRDADAERLGPESLKEIARRGFELGAHGVTHAALSRIDPGTLAAEVQGSIDDLRALGIEPTAFAYPYGDAGEKGGAVERAVRDAGVQLAVTTEERTLRRGDARLRLPRKVVPSQSLSVLATRLERLAWSG
ncbi:MAG TPA: polysaccharide deacetylase family protein [Dongiaceae bacterium]|nr:polysaccharide deacetylase family protein [Dongiaceae bacterium]